MIAPKAVRVVAVAGAALSVWLFVVVVQHAGQAVHDLPTGAVVTGVVGALASLVGWALVARSGDGVDLGAAVLALLLVGGVAALLSIGILLLLVGAGVSVVLGRVAGRRRAEGRPVPLRVAAVAAGLVGLGLPIAAGVASDGPLVECHKDGVSTSSSLFRSGDGNGSGAASGGGTSREAGTAAESRGEFSSRGRSYTYRCVGAELVEFTAFDT